MAHYYLLFYVNSPDVRNHSPWTEGQYLLVWCLHLVMETDQRSLGIILVTFYIQVREMR